MLAGSVHISKKWGFAGLQGISDATLEMHFGLYAGYVKSPTLLNERLTRSANAERRPMRIQRTPTGSGPGLRVNGMRHALGEAYGGFEQWKSDGIISIASRVQVRPSPLR
jgi:hypothetical protein